MLEEKKTCETLENFPNYHETFIDCPSVIYTIFSCINVVVAVLQLFVFIHLLYMAPMERKREVPYLVSLPPICSIISVIILFNLATSTLLSAFRYVYLVFCVIQFYQYLSSYYGDFRDILRMISGFSYDAEVCCCCCKFTRTVVLTRNRIIANKACTFTGIISYIIIIMATLAFEMTAWLEDVLLVLGVILYVMAIVCTKRLITITQQFYPEVSTALQQKWVPVRICFFVIGLQGLSLKTMEAVGGIPPVDLFNSKVMVDVIHNMVVPGELLFAMILAHKAFTKDEPATLEVTPLLTTSKNIQTDSNFGLIQASSTDQMHGSMESFDNKYQSFQTAMRYGSLSAPMMHYIEQSLDDGRRRSEPDSGASLLFRAGGYEDELHLRSVSSSPGGIEPNYSKGERCIQML